MIYAPVPHSVGHSVEGQLAFEILRSRRRIRQHGLFRELSLIEAPKPQVEIQMWLSVLHIGRDACQNLCRLLFLALSTQRNIKPVRAIDQAVAEFLSPAIAARVEPYVFVIGMAELLLALWPVVMDVNEQRWKEQASTAGVS